MKEPSNSEQNDRVRRDRGHHEYEHGEPCIQNFTQNRLRTDDDEEQMHREVRKKGASSQLSQLGYLGEDERERCHP